MAAGLIPKEPAYGDQTTLRRLGVKSSPVTATPTFFNPQGGRPPKVPMPGAGGQAPALGAPQQAPPPAAGISAEHQSLYQRSVDLAAAARTWTKLAESPLATARVKQIAQAVREAARLAILDARNGTPYVKGL
jgi:hypothetical protein